MRKISKSYNLKKEFERPRDFDFQIFLVQHRVIDGIYQAITVPTGSFSLFNISVLEARAICNKFSVTSSYVCTCKVIGCES